MRSIARRRIDDWRGMPPRPVIDLDFTKGGLPAGCTLTRSTAGTHYRSDGLIVLKGINVSRINFDPVTKDCLGLLVEEGRTNMLLDSEDVNGWISRVGLDSALVADSPSSLSQATKITVTAAFAFLYQEAGSAGAGNSVTISCYAKYDNTAMFQIIPVGDAYAGLTECANFDLVNGTCAAIGGGRVSMQPAANGHWRCMYTIDNCAAGTADIWISLCNTLADAASPTLTVGHSAIVSSPQVEVGWMASSYIPTEATAVARTADNTTYKTSTGVLYPQFTPDVGTAAIDCQVHSLPPTGYNYPVWEMIGALQIMQNFKATGVGPFAIGLNPYPIVDPVVPYTRVRQAFAWRINDVGVKSAGLRLQRASAGNFVLGGTIPGQLSIGWESYGGRLNGTIRSLRIWKDRLPNEVLNRIYP